MVVPSGTEAARAFIPAKDLDLSKAFYQALGSKKLLDGDVAIFGVGASAFILQRYYKKEWAENCMMQMMVDNLDAWWKQALDLPKLFGAQAPKAPAMQSWGLRVSYVYDPSGVLWHVAERRENEPAD
ncbi:MAG: glyoxalase [Xanthobacteraceae bacterium]